MKKIKIPLASPVWEYEQLKSRIDEAVGKVLSDGKYILGPDVERFEKEAAGYLGVGSSVGVSSGTDALLAALMAAGVGPGDEVVTTAFSFIATASPVVRVGAVPVFVDIEEDGYNMDPALIEKKVTKKTKAVIVVHLFGQPADMDDILRVAHEKEIMVIEDAAQAFGALYGTHKAGTMGDFGCFSFFPAKPLGGAGDCGLIVCGDEEKENLLRMIRTQGASGKNVHPVVGGNFRLDTLQAAILRVKLSALDGWIDTRRKHARLYFTKLETLRGSIVLPSEKNKTQCVWAQFSILVQRRNDLKNFLIERGIGCAVYYPLLLPFQDSMAVSMQKSSGAFPQAERAAGEILSLPIHPSLSAQDIEEVAQTIREFYES